MVVKCFLTLPIHQQIYILYGVAAVKGDER